MTDTTEQTIRALLEERFPDATIRQIELSPEVDRDGEAYLKVLVVLEVPGGKLDPHGRKGLIRHLRPLLDKINEPRFPVFSFMTPEDYEGAAA